MFSGCKAQVYIIGIVTLLSLRLMVHAVPLSAALADIMLEERVQCHTQFKCVGTATEMSYENCCVKYKEDRSYSTAGQCKECIVYGWLAKSVEMIEKLEPYKLRVGYIKGSGPDLAFNIVVEQGSTKHKADYTVSPQYIQVFSGTSPSIVEVDTFLDGVALEEDEHFTLKLELVGGSKSVPGLFRDSLAVTLIDTDDVDVSFTSDNYRVSESNGTMTVVATKNKRIASPLTLIVTPMNVSQAVKNASNGGLRIDTIPADDKPRSPNRAKSYPIDKRDFGIEPITVRFLPDEDSPVNDISVPVQIVDDDVNEAPEEYFIVRLDKAASSGELVSLTEPRESLCRIVDDDPIRIGFQQPSYTVQRPAFEHYFENVALLTMEDNRKSEQTFNMVVEVVAASPSTSIGVVSEDVAHNLIHYGRRTVVRQMASGVTQVDIPFELIPYDLPPQRTAFEIVISSDNEPFFLPAKRFHQSTFIVIEAAKEAACTDGKLRLVGGARASEGRVEVCHKSVWGSVCDDLWNNVAAGVVCKQLGFSTEGAIATSRAHFGSGSGSILLDNVECTGREPTLLQCQNLGLGVNNCNHDEDAGVICKTTSSGAVCQDGDIRLAGGSSRQDHEGRVEVCYSNQWGTVCDDLWDKEDALVACKQLGLPHTNAIAHKRALFGQGDGLILLNKVECKGDENRLFDCPRYFATHNCLHSEDAGVSCQ